MGKLWKAHRVVKPTVPARTVHLTTIDRAFDDQLNRFSQYF